MSKTKSTIASRLLSYPPAQGEERERLIANLQIVHKATRGSMNLSPYSLGGGADERNALYRQLTGRRFERGDTRDPCPMISIVELICVVNRALGLHESEPDTTRKELASAYLTMTGARRRRPTR